MLRGNPPYGRPRNAAAAMIGALRKADLKDILLKRFHDWPGGFATTVPRRRDEAHV
jgi:hypothetical protein